MCVSEDDLLACLLSSIYTKAARQKVPGFGHHIGRVQPRTESGIRQLPIGLAHGGRDREMRLFHVADDMQLPTGSTKRCVLAKHQLPLPAPAASRVPAHLGMGDDRLSESRRRAGQDGGRARAGG